LNKEEHLRRRSLKIAPVEEKTLQVPKPVVWNSADLSQIQNSSFRGRAEIPSDGQQREKANTYRGRKTKSLSPDRNSLSDLSDSTSDSNYIKVKEEHGIATTRVKPTNQDGHTRRDKSRPRISAARFASQKLATEEK